MPEYSPIIYLRDVDTEHHNKGGGGKSKEPWVDIDATGLRDQLVGQVQQSLAALRSLPSPQRAVGVPLRIELRDKAVAKSSRPDPLLEAAGLVPVAAERPGQLVSQLVESNGAILLGTIEGGTTKRALYDISTIVDIRVHDPLLDAFKLPNEEALQSMIDEAVGEGRLIRIEVFPWIRPDTQWTQRHTLLDHLQEIGLEVRGVRGPSTRRSIYVRPSSSTASEPLALLSGIRRAGLEPLYSHGHQPISRSMIEIGPIDPTVQASLAIDPGPAVVGVLDSGVDSSFAQPWIVGREDYDLGSERDSAHGTFVAGLVLAAHHLNGNAYFGPDTARIVDAQVLPSSEIGELALFDRINEVVQKYPDVKVWNCSFNSNEPLDPVAYGALAGMLDRLAESRGLLFVQAAGNYTDLPRRVWPPTVALEDAIGAPAEAVNSLVVGSLSHRGGAAPVGAPACYSRRGPGFGGISKPDVTYWSGDFGPAGELPHAGIVSLTPTNTLAESVGTSFATPLVSAIAANVWSELDTSALSEVTPTLVKGLLVHGASLSRNGRPQEFEDHRDYFGAGVPPTGLQSLFDDDDSFTTVHEVKLASKASWLRTPFPIPACLFTPEGKLRAEVFMTVAYAPLLDPAFEDEAVRTSVEASFGPITFSNGRPTIDGMVPADKGATDRDWEITRIQAGKWSPVRTHHSRFPRGVGSGDWGLKLTLTERADDPDGIIQPVYVIVTLRGFDEGLPVHLDGLAAVRALRLWNVELSSPAHIRVQT